MHLRMRLGMWGCGGEREHAAAGPIPQLDLHSFACAPGTPLPAPGLDWVAANAQRPAVVTLSLGVPSGEWSAVLEDAVRAVTRRWGRAGGAPVRGLFANTQLAFHWRGLLAGGAV